jgi:ubiquinone/menaquinone biosynthesis C-methylase UbiE
VTAAGVALGGIALVAFAWRAASRRWQLPCPAWLGWLVESPYMDAVAGSAALLDRAAVGSGMRVLDAGCGPGRVTISAAERVGPVGEVVGLDLQEPMLARLRRKAAVRGLTNVRTVRGQLEAGVVERDSFDRAFLVTVLGEIPDRAAALRALHAALRPGGVLSVTELIPDPHYQSRRTVRRLAEAAGFRPDQTYATPLAFTMNFRKPA